MRAPGSSLHHSRLAQAPAITVFPPRGFEESLRYMRNYAYSIFRISVEAETPRFPSLAPAITGKQRGHVPDSRAAFIWAGLLAVLPAAIAIGLSIGWSAQVVLLGGLLLFGALFAVNSSLHSYLIVSYAKEDGVSLAVGFYYMANALGRLVGTLLSGWVYQAWGLEACLWVSTIFVLLAALISIALPRHAAGQVTGT